MYEIFIQLQTDIRAFFRMELRCENIVAGDSATEWRAIFRFTDHMIGLFRYGIKTVDEIKETLVGNTIPQRMWLALPDLIPSHLGNFVTRSVFLKLAVELESDDLAGQQAESFGVPFLAPVKKHLFADADSEYRFVARAASISASFRPDSSSDFMQSGIAP